MSCECNAVCSAEAEGNESSPLVYRAYIETDDGVPLVQADVSTISLKVFADGAATATYTIASITVATVVYDTLQTWAGHSQGFNFKHTVPGAAFPDGAVSYQGEYKITLANGQILWAVFTNATLDMLTE